MRALKVWGGATSTRRIPYPNGSRQARTIVAARTKKHAVELLNRAGGAISSYQFNIYWGQTANKEELALATEEGVWINQGPEFSKDFFEQVILAPDAVDIEESEDA